MGLEMFKIHVSVNDDKTNVVHLEIAVNVLWSHQLGMFDPFCGKYVPQLEHNLWVHSLCK
jgi:hypothetical protein